MEKIIMTLCISLYTVTSLLFGQYALIAAETTVAEIDRVSPDNVERATFALGWFWGPDAQFGAIKGVIRTRVGYAGGSTQDPTYRNIGDHSEAIQIDYDPQQISYQELLRIFWSSHYPSSPTSGQYRSAIFYHSAKQQQAAQENKGQEENRSGQKMYTEIEAFQEFYLAEDYHQKYTLRNREQFFYEYNILFPEILDFVNSTATARVNGYLAGHGTLEMLQEEFGLLGLSEQAQKELLDIVRRNSQ